MINNNDYQLEDAETAAVNKSKNLKRGLAIGGAAAVASGATAFGATKLAGSLHDELTDELTSDDLLAGAQAGADGSTADAVVEETPQTHVHETHYHFHNTAPEPAPEPTPEPQLAVDETAILLDENGEYIAAVDSGTYDGKSFMVLDTDGNGKGDMLAYDENNNGVYEDNEITYIDNETYQMGQGSNYTAYQQNQNGEFDQIYSDHNPSQGYYAQANPSNDIRDIRNDFEDEKTGEVYTRDLAENNPDYNNHDDARQYSAGMDDIVNDAPETPQDYNDYDPAAGEPLYGYQEPDYLDSSNDATDTSFDDASIYDA